MGERFSTMPPHSSMPHSIPPGVRRRDRGARIGSQGRTSINKSSEDDPYGAGFDGDVSRHVVEKPSRVNRGSERFDEYIGPVDVIPGEQLLVIAELRGVIVNGKFVPQPTKTPEHTRVLVAKARIGLNREGFFEVKAAGNLLRMRVGDDATGTLQKVSMKTPSYDPERLVVEYKNSLVIASA